MKAVEQFLQYLEFEKRYSKLTIRSYQNDLFQFIAFCETTFENKDSLAFQHTHIRSWLASLKSEADLSATSINRKISALKSFYKYHLKMGNITTLPTTKIVSPKKAKRLPAFANETQMNRLFDEVAFGDTFQDFTDRLIIDLLYATGMRRSELLNLKQNNIDYIQGQVKVLGKGRKERIIPLLPEIVIALKNYIQLRKEANLEGNESLLVKKDGTNLYEKYIYLVAKKYLSMVSAQDKKSPHTLRHSFATHLLNKGAELNAVKELLGHSSLAATQIYTHNSIDKLKNTFKKAHPKA